MRACLMFLLLAGCPHSTRPCRDRTVQVTLALDETAAAADTLRVEVSLAGRTLADEVPHRPGVSGGALAVEFPSGYPAGQSITLLVEARTAGQAVARGSVQATLSSGCTSLGLAVTALAAQLPDLSAGSDLRGAADLGTVGDLAAEVDAAEADAAGVDAAPDLSRFANGTACSGGAECASGQCVDGYCCDSPCDGACEACDVNPGSCTAVVTGQPRGARPACAGAGTPCGGVCSAQSRTACAYPGISVSCRAQSCSGNLKTFAAGCDGAGACPAAATTTCATTCSGNDCLGACQSDSQCTDASKPYCNQGSCLATKPNGRTCGNLSQCTSGQCVDGVCCESACSGQCQACDLGGSEGQCRTLISGQPHGSRTACAGSGVCQGSCSGSSANACGFPQSATVCSPQSCNGGVQSNAAGCNGAGACQTPTTQSCAPFACEGTAACFASCSSDAQCGAATPYCNGSTCKTTLPNGRACMSSGQCTSGHCVDGTCCGNASCSTCFACNVAGHEGDCFAAPLGTSCGITLCDNTGSGFGHQECNGAGSCGSPRSFTSCAPYKCNGATGSCFTDCGGCDNGAPEACGSAEATYCAGGHSCTGTCCSSPACECDRWTCQ